MNQEVTLGVTWAPRTLPRISGTNEAILSPVIIFESTGGGSHFERPVRLKIPACAEKLKDCWHLKILKSNQWTTSDCDINWNPLTLDDYTERVVSSCCLLFNRLSLIYHWLPCCGFYSTQQQQKSIDNSFLILIGWRKRRYP